MQQLPAVLPLTLSQNTLALSLPGLAMFCATYERGSFSGAARALGVTPQAVSRAIGRLESSLGVPLIRRSTRLLKVTAAGERYYAACRQSLELLEAAQHHFHADALGPSSLSGQVCVSVPSTFAHYRFLPLLGEFVKQYPSIIIETRIESRNVDFVQEGVDFAIRMGQLRDMTLVARKLGDFSVGTYASPAYLERTSVPHSPSDLRKHACIGFVLSSTRRVLPWSFSGGLTRFVPKGPARVLEDPLAVVTLATAGVGVAQGFDFLAAPQVESGRLVEVLSGFRASARSFAAVYPKAIPLSLSARTLLEFLLAKRGPQRRGA